MLENKPLTGYPSIDKPWLKYYAEKDINTSLPECTIYEYLWDNNKDYLDGVALKYFGRRISFGILFEEIHSVANAFAAFGIHGGDTVAVCLPSIPEAVYIIYALNLLGAIPNMLDPRYNESLLEYCLTEASTSYLFTYDGCYEKFLRLPQSSRPENIVLIPATFSAPTSIRLINAVKKSIKPQQASHLMWKDFLKNQSVDAVARSDWSQNECAVILHTGGTTGNPKGVMLSNYSINAIAHQYNMLVNPKRGETLLDIIPPFASYGLCTSMHMPLSLGLSVELIPKFDAGKIGLDVILDLLENRGGWSIWFTVFCGCDDVRNALLDFPGTARQCFDAANHYEPLDRNPGLADPT